ncbi:MAG: DUF2155 domain-containing protein [Rhodospirillales bacterium]|nr:DUF2155 domain-containing protein [Rhodospirillales bacterium]
MVVLRVLEKGPARAYAIEAPLHATTRVGPLEIVPTRCWEPPPEDVPESAAFLVITERDPAGRFAGSEIFRGWMFASSPGLSALEYPTHDVWVLDCRLGGTPATEPRAEPPTPPVEPEVADESPR